MKDQNSIREASLNDFDEINILLSYLGYPIPDSQLEERRKIFEMILKNPNLKIFLSISEDGISVDGMISYTLVPQLRHVGLKMEIDELVVSPKRSGVGIGGHLVAFVTQEAKKNGVKKIIVSTNRDRESFQREFYKKLGFTEKNSAFFELTP